MLQYGGFTPLTDKLVDMHEAPILDDINKQNAEQCARTKEALLWAVLGAATNVQYANAETQLTSVAQPLDYGEQALAVRTLSRNKAKQFTQILSGGVKINTTPIEAAYLAFCHTDVKDSIRAMAGFTPVAQYGSMKPVSPHEFGSVNDVRYLSLIHI